VVVTGLQMARGQAGGGPRAGGIAIPTYPIARARYPFVQAQPWVAASSLGSGVAAARRHRGFQPSRGSGRDDRAKGEAC